MYQVERSAQFVDAYSNNQKVTVECDFLTFHKVEHLDKQYFMFTICNLGFKRDSQNDRNWKGFSLFHILIVRHLFIVRCGYSLNNAAEWPVLG